MKKIIIIVLATVVLLAGVVAGLHFGGIINLTGEAAEQGAGVEVITDAPMIDTNAAAVEVPLLGLLIPVNHSKRQNLLLLDLYLATSEDNQAALQQQFPRIKNKILKEFSTKPVEYFRSEGFFIHLQEDINTLFTKEKGWRVREALVTKAVYQ